MKSAFPEAPDDFTGFEIPGILNSGRQKLTIEVQLDDGVWQLLLSHHVKIRRRWWPFWLGGGNWAELFFSQFPCRMQSPPRTLKLEEFPSLALNSTFWPKLSIVSPSLQQAPFLRETLRGVLLQPMVDCEYVVQDGGSTDGSLEIISQLDQEQRKSAEKSEGPSGKPGCRESIVAHPRLTAWSSESDKGQADAIAKGFAKTSGGLDDLMAWINSDDFYLPGALAFVADYFARHPEVDVIYGHRILVDESSKEIGRWFLPRHNDDVLRLNDFVPQETMFWRRRIWDQVGGIDPSFQFAMDWDLLLRFQAAGAKIVRVPYFLACFRIHSAQKSSTSIHDVGQREIDLLRTRANGRIVPPAELENSPLLLRYLRRSALVGLMWRLGIRLG